MQKHHREEPTKPTEVIPAPEPATVDDYREALAAFRKLQPYGITRFRHDQACWAAEMFLTQWGSLAAGFGWTADDIFAMPRDAASSGLAYWLGIELVTAVGPGHAVTGTKRVFDRVARQTWKNPYAGEVRQ